MKRLIQNNFLYYLKNKTKLLLSITFILSFISMLFVYDNFELNKISKEANMYRMNAYAYRDSAHLYPEIAKEYLEEIDFWNQAENKVVFEDSLFGEYEYVTLEYNGEDQRIHEQLKVMEELEILTAEMYDLMSSYASLYAGGRMNIELTPYRYEINKVRLELYELIGEEYALEMFSFENPKSLEYVSKEQDRLTSLMNSQTPDDFNEYTVSIANYPSKVFEGLMLFITLVLLLALFYDLFSKDFDFQTYRTLFTEPYTRKTVVRSKVLFAMLYTVLLILIGMVSVIVYLLVVRRVGYNVLSTRFGYMLHPVLMNINVLSIFNAAPHYIVLPLIVKNLLMILSGFGLITLWLFLILTISFKSKSSASTLTLGVFGLLALFFVSLTPLKDLFTYIFPIFGFNIEAIFNGDSPINMLYLLLSTAIYIKIASYILYKDIDSNDLLGGDGHD